MKRSHSKAKSTLAMVLALSMTLQQSGVITLANDLTLLDMEETDQELISDPPEEEFEISEEETSEALPDETGENVSEAIEAEAESFETETLETDPPEADLYQDLPEPASAEDAPESKEIGGKLSSDLQKGLDDFAPDTLAPELEDSRTDPAYLKEFLYSENGITASIYTEEAAEIPVDAQFHIDPIEKDSLDYTEMDMHIREELGYGETAELDYLPFEMYFTAADTEEKIEPKDGLVSVVLTFDEPVSLGEHAAPVKSTAVAHEGENGYESLEAYEEFKLIDYVQTELEVEQSVEETASLLEEDGVAEQVEYTEEQVSDADSVAESDAGDATEDGGVVEEDAAAAETAETPADAPEPAVQADPAQNTKKVYDISVNGIAFATTRFSKFAGVVEYEEETAEQIISTKRLNKAQDFRALEANEGEGGSASDGTQAQDPVANYQGIQDLAAFLQKIEIEGTNESTAEDGATYISVKDKKKYKIVLSFSEDEDSDDPEKQFSSNLMYYRLPELLSIPNADELTEANKKSAAQTIQVPLQGLGENGGAYNVNLHWWIESGVVFFEWDMNDADKEKFEKCFNTFMELEINGSITKDGTINWGGIVGEKTYKIDGTRKVDITKAFDRFDPLTNTAHYKVTLTSEGVNEEVKVLDTIGDTAFKNGFMKFQAPMPLTIKKSTTSDNAEITQSIAAVSEEGKKFEYTIPQMDDGEVIEIDYSVTLSNMSNLTPSSTNPGEAVSIGTNDQTKNSIGVTYKAGSEVVVKNNVQEIGLEGIIKVDKIGKSASRGSQITDGEDVYEVLNWTITLQSRPEPALNMGGKTISDSIANQDTWNNNYLRENTEYYGDGITITVKDAKGKSVGESWTVPYTSLEEFVNGDEDTNRHWAYKIPEEKAGNPITNPATSDNGNSYYYSISYSTKTKINELVEEKNINNVGTGYGSKTGTGTVGPIGKNEFKLRKNATARNGNIVTWTMEVDVPAIGLDGETYLEDTLPKDSTGKYDTLVEGSVTINGLLEGEGYTITYYNEQGTVTDDQSKAVKVRVDFYKSDDKQDSARGLNSTNEKRQNPVTVTLQTNNNSEWAPEADGKTKLHQNEALFYNGKISRTAIAKVVSNPYLEKDMELLDTTSDGMPVIKSTITMYGPIGTTFHIGDSYDERLVYFNDDTHPTTFLSERGNANGTVTVAPVNPESGVHNVTFTINDFVANNDEYKYVLTYYLKVRSADDFSSIVNEATKAENHSVTLQNTATSTMFGETTATINYTYSPVDKSCTNKELLNKNNRIAHFRIDINKEKLDLNPEADWLIVPDEYESGMSVDFKSIIIVEERADGSTLEIKYPYTNLNSTTHSYWDASGNVITFTIPDNTHIVITYDAEISGWGNVSVNNTVSVMGYSQTEKVTADFGSKSRAGASAYKIFVKKYEDGNMTKPIEGVSFKLFQEKGSYRADGTWVSEPENGRKTGTLVKNGTEETFTTDAGGMIEISGLRRNTYYYLEEQTLLGTLSTTYRQDNVQYTFRISADGSYDYSYPTFTYHNNDCLTIRNETKVMSIPVTKVWEGYSETETKPEVTFRLTTDGSTQANQANADGTPGNEVVPDLVLNSENNWRGSFTNVPRRDASGNLINYIVQEVIPENAGYISDNGKRVDDSRDNRIDKGFIFTNIKKEDNSGIIKVTKTVLPSGRKGDVFRVQITPVDSEGNTLSTVDLSKAEVTGTLVYAVQNNRITFQIKNGETVIVANLPYGNYLVEEQNTGNSGFTASYNVGSAESSTSPVTVTLDNTNTQKDVSITNTFTEHKLTVIKSVLGGLDADHISAADAPVVGATKQYKFYIELTDLNSDPKKYLHQTVETNAETNKTTITYSLAEEKQYFTVVQGKPFVLENIPVGSYTVQEVLDGTGNDSIAIPYYNFYTEGSTTSVPVSISEGSGDATATLVNKYITEKGKIKVTKTLTQVATQSDEVSVTQAQTLESQLATSDRGLTAKEFKFKIKNLDDLYLQNGGSFALDEDWFTMSWNSANNRFESSELEVPAGLREYTVIEKIDGEEIEIAHYNFLADQSKTEVKDISVKENNTTTVSLNNVYKPKMAKISIEKALSLIKRNWMEAEQNPATSYEDQQNALLNVLKGKEFTFSITREEETEPVDTLSITFGNNATITSKVSDESKWLPVGAYIIRETSQYDGGNDFKFDSVVFSGITGAVQQPDGSYKVTISDENDKQTLSASAENKYDKVKTYIEFKGKKTFTNGDLYKKSFDFQVLEGNTVVGTGTAKAESDSSTTSPRTELEFNFSGIGCKNVGEYTYTVKEVIPATATRITGDSGNGHYIEDGVEYDSHQFSVKVKVEKNDGTKDASVDNLKYSVIAIDGVSIDNTSQTAAQGNFEFTNAATQTKIKKVNENGQELAGARFELTRTDGDKIVDILGNKKIEWTSKEAADSSQDDPEIIYGLKDGKYQLKEISAPVGYYCRTVNFSVNDGKIIYTETDNAHPKITLQGDPHVGTIQIVTFQNYPTKFRIKKVDNETENDLIGADNTVLQLYEESDFGNGTTPSDESKAIGNEGTKEWSGKTERIFEKLPVGDYVLYEKKAPAGYDRFAPIHFTLKGDNSIEVKSGGGIISSINSDGDNKERVKLDGTADSADGILITARDTRVRAHLTIHKLIKENNNSISSRKISTTGGDDVSGKNINLSKAATFELYYQTGDTPDTSTPSADKLIATITTNASGYWSSSDSENSDITYKDPLDQSREYSITQGLVAGKYYLKEITPSDDMAFNSSAANIVNTFEIKENASSTEIGHGNTYETNIDNQLFSASIKLYKYDADTNPKTALNGAKFSLTKTGTTNPFTLTGVTAAIGNETGVLEFKNLPKGTYTLEEISNQGYDPTAFFKATIVITDADSSPIVINTSSTQGADARVTLESRTDTRTIVDNNGILNYRIPGSVELKKVDKDNPDTTLSDVEFELQVSSDGQNYTSTGVTELKTGKCYRGPGASATAFTSASVSEDTNGTAPAGILKITNLPWGKYRLVETAPKSGYTKKTATNNIYVDFEVDKNKQAYSYTVQADGMIVSNEQVDLKIYKKSKENGNKPLSGAEFRLDGPYVNDSGEVVNNGSLTLVTDSSGLAYIKDSNPKKGLKGVLLINTLYKLTETSSPLGFKHPGTDDSTVYFKLNDAGRISGILDEHGQMAASSYYEISSDLTGNQIVMKDYPIKLLIQKVDGSGNTESIVSGAKFEVEPDTGSAFADNSKTKIELAYQTNQYSNELFEQLICGNSYTVKETEAPYGYKIPNDGILFRINVSSTGEIEIDKTSNDVLSGNDLNGTEVTVSEPDASGVVSVKVSDAPINITLVKKDATDNRSIGGVQFTLKPLNSTKQFAGNISELTLVSSSDSANMGELMAVKDAGTGTYYTSAEFMKLLHVGYTYTLHEKEYVNNSLYKIISTDMNFTIGNDGKVTVAANANGSGAMSTDANQLTITVKNERELTTVKLTKKDDSASAKTIPEVEFSLWKLNAGGNEYTKVTDTSRTNSQGNYVTDTNGVLTIPDLGWGQYKLVEEKATGYDLPDPSGNSAVTIKFAIGADAASITDLSVKKYEAATENNIFVLDDVTNTRNTLRIRKTNKNGTTALGGAIFRLYKGSKSNDNLYASSADSDVTSTVRKLEESNGVFTINTIPDGVYILEETKAPNGYEIQDSQESISFRMETNGSISWDNSSSVDSALVEFEAKNGTTPNTITVKDEDIKLTVRKQSLVSSGETASLLSGAKFKLEHKKNDGTFEDVAGFTDLTTGNNGQVIISSTSIIHGDTYRLTETKAPAGYILYDPAPSVAFSVEKNGTVTFAGENTQEISGQYKISGSGTDTITFSERKTKLTIRKVDNETGAALDGATLEIYRAEDFNAPSGTAIGSPKTDVQPAWTGDSTNKTSAGVWIVEGLDAGTDGKEYYLYEKTAPSGYEKFVSFKFKLHPDNQLTYSDNDIQTITTSAGNTQRVSKQFAVSGNAKNAGTLTIQAADTRIRGYVTINKKIVNASDVEQPQRTPSVSGTAQNAVSLNKTGITFDLYYQNGTGNEKIAENLKTDAAGTWSYTSPNADIRWKDLAFSHGLPTGNYYFIETSSTEDLYYGTSDHKYSFTIGDTGTNAHLETVTPDVKNELFHADIQLTKLDWDAVNLGLTPTGMDGVSFQLEGPHADSADTVSNTISLTGTTSTVDGVAGVLKFSNLPKGTYELTETLPAGYDSNGIRKSVSGDKSEAFKALITITDADQNQTILVNSTTAQRQVTPISGTTRNKIQIQNGSLNENGILNYRSLGTIKVLKLSGDSTNSNERLNDAAFELQVKNASGQYVTCWSGLLTGNTYIEYDPAKSRTENDRTTVTEGKEGTHKGILEIKDLPWGTYRLVETKGADGYGSTHQDGKTVSSDDIVSVSNGFTIDADHLAYDFTSDSDGLKNYKNKLTIIKKDLNGTALANAEFDLIRLTDSASGRSEATVRTGLKTSAQGKIGLTGVLVSGGTYKLHETKAPEGYELITADIIFTVGNDGKLTVEDDSAYTSDSSQEGYFLPDDANNYYAVTITAKDTPIHVSLVKKETDSDRLLEDFAFTVRPAAGSHFSGSASTTDGAIVINKDNCLTVLNGALAAGNTYEITETGIPEGYEKAAKVTFKVNADGDVQILSGPASVSAYTPAASGSAADDLESQRITITDKPLTISIAKAEMQEASGNQTSTTYLDGAKFRLAPESGSRFAKQGDETTAPSVLEFETAGGVPYEISRRLIVGNTYKLTETKSPAGYVLSSPAPGVAFKVKEDGTLETKSTTVVSGEGAITVDNNQTSGISAILFTDRKTKLQISKVDNETGADLSGAELKIYQGTLTETGALSEDAEVKAVMTDAGRNADGTWTVTGLDAGEAAGTGAGVAYVLVESRTPDGYDTFAPLAFTLYPDNHIQTHSEIRQITTSFKTPKYDHEFVIADGGSGKNGGTIGITAVDTRVRGHFHIEKLIASGTDNKVSERVPTPEMSGENGKLTLNQSAVFKLFVMKGTAPGRNDPCIATITTDQSTGTWQSRYLEDSYKDPDDPDNTRPFKNGLPVGKYYLKEIFASKDMYYDEEAQDAVYRFDIAANQSARINGHNSDQKQQITNTLFVASVEVTKLDWDAIDRGEAPKTISDAEFTLKGTDSENRGILLTAATDMDGKAFFTNLPKGTYELAEASGVSGYALSGDRKEGEAKPFKATIIITDDSRNADGKHSITVNETTAKNSVTVRTFDQKADRVQTSPDVQITKSAGDWNKDGILNFRKLGSVKLGKEDGDTGEALNNAEFKLQKKTGSAGTDADYTDYLTGLQTGKAYYDIATRDHEADHTGTAGEKGVLLIHNLPWGTYRLVETKAADGYGITDKDGKVVMTQDFTISRDEKTHHPDLGIAENYKISLKLHKTGTQAKNPLAGAVFTLTGTYLNRSTTGEGASAAISSLSRSDDMGRVTGSLRLQSDGKGEISLDGVLIAGETYTLHEETAPEGFELMRTDLTFTVKNDGTVENAAGSAAPFAGTGTGYGSAEGYILTANSRYATEITAQDTRINVSIDKADAEDTKAAAGGAYQSLEGAKYKVTPASGSRFANASGLPIRDGAILIDDSNKDTALNGALLAGNTYILTETLAPKGYELAAPVTFTVNADGEVSIAAADRSHSYKESKISADGFEFRRITVKDEPVKISITKADLGDSSETPIKDAVFELKSTDGSKFAKSVDKDTLIITTENKEAVIDRELITGKTYTLTETKSPAGYVLSDPAPSLTFTVQENGKLKCEKADKKVALNEGDITVTDTENGTAAILFTDRQTKLKIQKADNETGAKLDGVTLQIYQADSFALDETTQKPATSAKKVWDSSDKAAERDKDGIWTIAGLDAGKAKEGVDYVLYEAEVPEGYLAFEPLTFTLYPDNHIAIVSTVPEIVTSASKADMMKYSVQITADADGTKGGAALITAADTRIRGHVTIDKDIVSEINRQHNGEEVSAREITVSNRGTGGKEAILKKAGATFDLYAVKDGEASKIAEKLTIKADDPKNPNVNWTSVDNKADTFRDPSANGAVTPFAKGLPAGSYYFAETGATEDLLYDDAAKAAKYEFTIGAAKDAETIPHNKAKSIRIENVFFHADIELTKLDKDGISDGDTPKFVEGAEFTLEKTDGSITLKTKTDANGKIRFANLPKGTYTLTECDTLDGYDLAGVRAADSKPFKAVITITDADQNDASGNHTIKVNSETARAVVTNEAGAKVAKIQKETDDGAWNADGVLNYRELGSAKLTKTDAKTGKALNDVRFALQEKTEDGFKDVEGMADLRTGHTYYYLETTGTLKKSRDTVEKADDGVLIVRNLPWNVTYRLIERKEIPGYGRFVPDKAQGDEVVTGAFSFDRKTLTFDAETVANRQTKFTLKKVGTEAVDKALTGAEFTLTGTYLDDQGNKAIDGVQTLVFTEENYQDGITLEGTLIANETYTLTETKAPAGYERIAADLKFTMLSDGTLQAVSGNVEQTDADGNVNEGYVLTQVRRYGNVITAQDKPIRVSVDKADAGVEAVGSYPSLAGANFLLTPAEGSAFTGELAGETSYEFETGKAPVLLDTVLIADHTYTLIETKAPQGYVLSNPAPGVTFTVQNDGTILFDKKTIVKGEGDITGSGETAVTSEGTAAILFTDRKTELKLQKIDNETSEYLDGAVLELYQADSFALNADGTVKSGIRVWTSENNTKDKTEAGAWTIRGLDAGTRHESVTDAADGTGSTDQGKAADAQLKLAASDGAKYVLYEKEAPYGYEKFAPVFFTLHTDNTVEITSEIVPVTTTAGRGETEQIRQSGTGTGGTAVTLTAVDTRTRAHVSIDKDIVDQIIEGQKGVDLTTRTSAADTESSRSLDRSGVTFDLYAVQSDRAEVKIAEGLTTDADGTLAGNVNWTSVGNTADTFMDPSDGEKEVSFATGLPAGSYYFLETGSTKDLLYDDAAQQKKYSFTIGETGQEDTVSHGENRTLSIENVRFHADIEVMKLDGDSLADHDEAETIEGTGFTLTGTGDLEDLVLSGKTGKDGTLTFSDLPKGTYLLKENDVLEGYDLSGGRNVEYVPFAAVITVTDEDHNADGSHTIRVNRGAAERTVKDTSGTYVSQIRKTAGTWNEDGILNYRKPVSLILQKVDAESGKELAGAEFELTGIYLDEEGNAVKGTRTLNVDTEEGTAWENLLLAGESYVLHETAAPANYRLIEDDLRFTVLPDGTLKADSEVDAETDREGYLASLEEAYEIRITARDIRKRGSVKVLKTDAGTDQPLEGAEMQIFDSEGVLAAEWTSGTESYEISELLTNEVYTLHEKKAPQGYGTAGDTTFVLNEDGALDAERTVTRTNTDGALLVEDGRLGAKLSVTKRLTVEDDDEEVILGAVDQTFYVQLFYDEACTTPVSEIRPLEYRNAVSATVVFDVDYGRTYYVKEVTEAGEPIDAGVADGAIFVAVFDEDDNSVTIDENGDGKASITFRNEFITVPSGFFYSHALTVTKQVRTASGEAKKTDEIFYAGIFADEGLTTLSDAVENQILPLEPGKEARASATTTVAAMPGTVLTLFVAEVNADGKPVNEDETFAYTVTIDADSVTFTDEVNTAEVTITNTEKPEINASPTPIASPSPTPVPDGTSGSDTSYAGVNSGDTPRTGDDTETAGYLAMLALSGIFLLIEAARKTKKGKK